MKNELKKIVLVSLYILIIIAFIYFYHDDYQSMNSILSHIDGDAISFNKDSGFYDDDITIKIKKNIEMPNGVKLYYTLDGNDPSINSKEYKGKIELKIDETTILYPLKVIAYYKGKYSDIIEKDYVLDKDVSNRFNMDVISITTDEYNLYDYYKGIMVAGVTADNYKKGLTNIKANFYQRSDEWLRNAKITMFDKNGAILLDQNVGVGIAGGTSSSWKVKSLKIVANKGFDKNNDKFILDLHNNENAIVSYVDKYNSLKLRSGSQDYDFGNIRSSVISRLASDSNFDGCTATRRSVVFLNGKFYGVFDIQQNYSSSYLKNRFGLDSSDKIEKYKGSEREFLRNNTLGKYFDSDLNEKENRETLEKYVDMDNFLLYYAIEILSNNTDWPDNSFEVWRYTGDYDKNNKYTDGRYRFLIYDTDLTFHTGQDYIYFEGDNQIQFVSIMESLYLGRHSKFVNVMKSKYYRDKFVTIVSDLLNTSFSSDNIEKIVDSEAKKVEDEYDHSGYPNSRVKGDFAHIKYSANYVKEEVFKNIEKYFDLNKKYNLHIETDEGTSIAWNNMTIYPNENYENSYYKNVDFEIKALPSPNYKFDYWLINGEKIDSKTLNINSELLKNGGLDIKAISKKTKDKDLIITELSARGDSDWIKISNITDKDIVLNNYFLSDNDKKMNKYQMPKITLKKGSSVIINGKNHYYSKGDYISNFNLKYGETIFLSKDDKIIDKIYVPMMSESESYGRYLNSNIYRYFYNKDDIRKK